jgi:hypothetical protein
MYVQNAMWHCIMCHVLRHITCTLNSDTNPTLGNVDHAVGKYNFYYILTFLDTKIMLHTSGVMGCEF